MESKSENGISLQSANQPKSPVGVGGGGGGGGGGLRPEVQTLTLLYTIFERKGTPFRKFYPFHITAKRVLLYFSFEKALKVIPQ